MIRPANIKDAGAIARIYNHYIVNTVVTFEEESVSDAEMQKRIQEIMAQYLWLVDEIDGSVVAYAYACPWKTRSAYRYSVELAVYVDKDRQRQGLGGAIYKSLLEEVSRRGIRVAIGGILVPNPASVTLHEKMGFKKVAHFEKVGFKFNQWLDVGYWEKILNN